MISPILQALIDQGLFDRIPPTFSTFFFDQIKDWETLFPAEQRYHERLFTLIGSLRSEQFESLFAPLRAIESKMGVNERNWPRRTFTLDNVDFLNRNAHYAEWRQAVTEVFAALDPVLDQQTAREAKPSLSIVLSPAELPVGPDRLWTRLKGRRVALAEPMEPRQHLAPLLAARGTEPAYERWVIQSDDLFEPPPATISLSYGALAPYRRRLMRDVEQLVEKENLRGPRELGARLKTLKVRAGESALAKDPRIAEFVRAVLLAGNGTLLINNTFVEWATVQAIRRARPRRLLASFGIRNKMKPFSSLLIYRDQEEASPVPTQMDTLGTYVDLEVLYLYIWQEFEKYAEYRNNTVHVFAAEGLDEALVIAPPDFSLPARVTPPVLTSALKEWMRDG
jgi:hypothetical protein